MDFKGRSDTLDIAKGIGIILVIAGHTFWMNWCYPIYAFHLPLFFVISGMLIKETRVKKAGEFIYRQLKSTIYPFIIMLCISLVIVFLIPYWRELITLKKVMVDVYLGSPDCAQNSSLWYLICYFFASFYFVLFYKVLSNKNFLQVTIFLILISIFVLLMPSLMRLLHLPANRLPLKMDTALVAAVFIGVGFWFREGIMKILSLSKNIIFLFCLFFMTIVTSYCNGQSNMSSLLYGKMYWAYFPSAIVGLIFILSISHVFERMPIISKVLIFYGRSSLVIFGFQSLMIRAYNLIVFSLFGEELILYGHNPLIHQVLSFCIVSFLGAPMLVCFWLWLKGKIRYE